MAKHGSCIHDPVRAVIDGDHEHMHIADRFMDNGPRISKDLIWRIGVNICHESIPLIRAFTAAERILLEGVSVEHSWVPAVVLPHGWAVQIVYLDNVLKEVCLGLTERLLGQFLLS